MANYHFEAGYISRRNGGSLTRYVNYMTGERLDDTYLGKTFYRKRDDVIAWNIYLPEHAPNMFKDLQFLCSEIESCEKRSDARTAREFKASLPNELSDEKYLKSIVSQFVTECFTSRGLCAITAIHEGHNPDDPSRNNPHVHIVVATRTVDSDGFSSRKYRKFDSKEFLLYWRKQWELIQNRNYILHNMPQRVSCESFKARNEDRIPHRHLTRIDWEREKMGIQTVNGDHNRMVDELNEKKLEETKTRGKHKHKCKHTHCR